MKAMILAAGRGERMRPLTDTLPKPLLKVKGKELIVYHIEKLAAAGFSEVIVNLGYLGFKIKELLQDGSQFGIKISYSDEQIDGVLESAGGIKKALPLLGDKPFLVVNGDVFTNYVFDVNKKLNGKLAHLIVVPNPAHNLDGDFLVDDKMYTFSGIGYYHPHFFKNVTLQKAPLAPLLRKAIELKKISFEVFKNIWHDVGTPQRLKEINNEN
jgi:MurNAc alpha-1-phosphate uridylyltransferase